MYIRTRDSDIKDSVLNSTGRGLGLGLGLGMSARDSDLDSDWVDSATTLVNTF